MPSRLQFSLRTALIAVFVLALVTWPTSRWLRTYLANRGLVPVTGRVIYRGQPLLAKVVLTPVAGGVTSQGMTKADGTYELESFVRPGDYAVGITEAGTAQRGLPRKFADGSTSGLMVSVSERGSNHFRFDLRN